MKVHIDDMLVKNKKFEQHFNDLKETFHTLKRYKMKLNPTKCTFNMAIGKFLEFMVT